MKIALDKKRRFSLALQYAVTMMVLITIGMTILAAIMVYNQIRQSDRYIDDFGTIITGQLANGAIEPLLEQNRHALIGMVNTFPIDQHIASVGIISRDRIPFAAKGELPGYGDLDLEKQSYRIGGQWRYRYPIQPPQVVHIRPIDYQGETLAYAVVVFSQEFFDEQFKEQLSVMLVMFIMILVLAVIASLFLGRRLSSPIRDLINATESIREGKLDIIYDRRNDEIGALINAINNMSQGLIRKAQVETMLDRVLSKDVKQKVMDQLDTVRMAGEHVEATVLFADMAGFTRISEKISPEEVQELLNEYYGYFNACARFYFGTVDKYIGDCVMVVFGATRSDPEHQYHAIACASLMQKLAEQLNKRREAAGIYPIELRIGINSGRMMAGLIGSSDRMEYTVVGDAVNLASRLCSEATESQIIIEEALYDAVNPHHKMEVEAHKEIRVRGKEEPVVIYSVVSVEQTYRVVSSDLIEDILSKNSH